MGVHRQFPHIVMSEKFVCWKKSHTFSEVALGVASGYECESLSGQLLRQG